MMPKLTVFGICPVCGSTGIDGETGERLTGYELKKYKGQDMCTLCIIRLKDQEYGEIDSEKHIEQEDFFNAVGVKKTVQ